MKRPSVTGPIRTGDRFELATCGGSTTVEVVDVYTKVDTKFHGCEFQVRWPDGKLMPMYRSTLEVYFARRVKDGAK